VRQATAKYHDFNVALADGFILPPGTECVQDPQADVMGLHVINPARLMDQAINILEPEILLYMKSGEGLKLLGVEYSYGIGKPGSELKNVPQLYPSRPSFSVDHLMDPWKNTNQTSLRITIYMFGSGRQIHPGSLPHSTRM
jgi:hypothetical protein